MYIAHWLLFVTTSERILVSKNRHFLGDPSSDGRLRSQHCCPPSRVCCGRSGFPLALGPARPCSRSRGILMHLEYGDCIIDDKKSGLSHPHHTANNKLVFALNVRNQHANTDARCCCCCCCSAHRRKRLNKTDLTMTKRLN